MLWWLLFSVVAFGVLVLQSIAENRRSLQKQAERHHEEQMTYLRYLRDLVAAGRAENREYAGLTPGGAEFRGPRHPMDPEER